MPRRPYTEYEMQGMRSVAALIDRLLPDPKLDESAVLFYERQRKRRDARLARDARQKTAASFNYTPTIAGTEKRYYGANATGFNHLIFHIIFAQAELLGCNPFSFAPRRKSSDRVLDSFLRVKV